MTLGFVCTHFFRGICLGDFLNLLLAKSLTGPFACSLH